MVASGTQKMRKADAAGPHFGEQFLWALLAEKAAGPRG